VIFRNPEHDLIATHFQLPLILETTHERVERAHQAHRAVARRFMLTAVLCGLFAALGYLITARAAFAPAIAGVILAAITACGLILARNVLQAELRARDLLGVDGVQVIRIDNTGVTFGNQTIPHENIARIRGIKDSDPRKQRLKLYREGTAHTASIGIQRKDPTAPEIHVPFDAYLEREALEPFLAVAEQVSAERYLVG